MLSAASPLHRSMNALTAQLQRADGPVSLANALWVQAGFPFEQPFLDLLAAEYGTGVRVVDYARDPEAARARINAWVSDATKDRIAQLLAPGAVDAITRLTIVNAIYMKARVGDAVRRGGDEGVTVHDGVGGRRRRADDVSHPPRDDRSWRGLAGDRAAVFRQRVQHAGGPPDRPAPH